MHPLFTMLNRRGRSGVPLAHSTIVRRHRPGKLLQRQNLCTAIIPFRLDKTGASYLRATSFTAALGG